MFRQKSLSNTTKQAIHKSLSQLSPYSKQYSTPTSSCLKRDLSQLQDLMLKRRIAPVYEDLTSLNAHRLDILLSEHVSWIKPSYFPPSPSTQSVLKPPYHLVYFEPSLPTSALLSDGTNPNHSPPTDLPFSRRLWSGGSFTINDSAPPLYLDGARAVCVERISDVNIHSSTSRNTTTVSDENDRIIVRLERRLARLTTSEQQALDASRHEGEISLIEKDIETRLWDNESTCPVIEQRTLTFLHDESEHVQPKGSDARHQDGKRSDVIFEHTLVPSPALLFRYSALTYNAHAIHLDPNYCREKEGLKERLMHGSLGITFLLVYLKKYLSSNERVRKVEYRNLRKIYCGQKINCYASRLDSGDGGKYRIWIEGQDGDMLLRGTVWTIK